MATKKKSAVGTSVINPTSAQAQNTEVGTGSGAALGIPVLADPPKPGAPIVPAGFIPPVKSETQTLLHPMAVQESHVLGVVAELANLASQPFWQGAMASGLTSPTKFSNLLTAAVNWSNERTNARAWSAYTGAQRNTAWDQALAEGEPFELLLSAYLAANPSMVGSVSATQSFLSARGAVAQRSATTRNAPKVAQARATKATANAAKATNIAQATAAAEAVRRAGDATITPPGTAPASATPAGNKGGVTIT